jgi:uncharacterized protein (AIM24 family)
MLTGQNFFISDYTYQGPEGSTGQVVLGTDFPSKIIRLNANEYGGKLVCQKGALLCAAHTIDIDMEFTKSFSGGFFGGEGFVLQALTGFGDVFLKAGGTLIRRDLKPGEELRISSGCLVGFSEGVEYGKSYPICVCWCKYLNERHLTFRRCSNGKGVQECSCWWRRSIHGKFGRKK